MCQIIWGIELNCTECLAHLQNGTLSPNEWWVTDFAGRD